jgi:imidazolonepropionase-like amidohydrolase
MTKRWWLAVSAVVVLAAAMENLDAQPARPASPQRLALVGGMLLDGYDAPPLHHAAVLIEGDRIVRVGPAASTPVPEGYTVIDTRGRTMMPGMIELHAHLVLLGHGNYATWFPWIDRNGGDVMLRTVMATAAAQLLDAGVTSAVDLGAPLEASLAVRRDIDAGRTRGPRMLMSGPWITRTPAVFPESYQVAIDSPEAAARAVTRLADAGVDVIKAHSGLRREDYVAIAETAHRRGLRVHAHVYAEGDVRNALETGIDVLQHAGSAGTAPPYSAALITDIANAGRPVVITAAHRSWIYPDTAAFPERLQDPALARSMPPTIWREIEQSNVAWRALPYFSRTDREVLYRERGVRQFIESGAVLGMGTDSGTPLNFHTEALWREARVHADLGMSPMRVISALTRVGATILGRQRDLGTIEPGKLADIIVLQGNPLFDITALAYVDTVVKGGRVEKRPVQGQEVRP